VDTPSITRVGSTMLLPHVSLERQSLAQPSPEAVLPSSQTSSASRRALAHPTGKHAPP
jgi:hypothetical protein